jgi:hypothetical protein
MCTLGIDIEGCIVLQPLGARFTFGLMLLLCWPIACVAGDQLGTCSDSEVGKPRDQ